MPLGSEAPDTVMLVRMVVSGGCGRDDRLWCWMKTLVMGLLWSGCLHTPPPHPNLTEILTPKLIVLGGGGFER